MARSRLSAGPSRPWATFLAATFVTSAAFIAPASASQVAHGAPLGGTFSSAIIVPGTSALNVGLNGTVGAVSCPSPGNCVAVGVYHDHVNAVLGFVASEVSGVWHNAQPIPGLAALNVEGDAEVDAVSCPSPGNCVLGGQYRDKTGAYHAFTDSEIAGAWKLAAEVPGISTLDVNGESIVTSISCYANGFCSIGGSYDDASSNTQAFLSDMSSGVLATASAAPNTINLNAGGDAVVRSISCPVAGSCVAAGVYRDHANDQQVFVTRQVSGIWQSAAELAGTATLNAGGSADVSQVSCAAAGDCGLGGSFEDVGGHSQAMVATMYTGTWANAYKLPGTATLNTSGSAVVQGVACPAPRRCVAVGYYTDATGQQPLTADEINGSWSTAAELPGGTTLNAGGAAALSAVACASGGNCVAGGSYEDHAGNSQVLVAQEVAGTWLNAAVAPGSVTLNAGGSARVAPGAASCSRQGTCLIGGTYAPSGSHQQAFVADYAPPASAISTSSARTGIAALAGTLFTTDPAKGTVTIQGEWTGTVVRTVPVPGATDAVSDGTHVWVSSATTSSLYELSTTGSVLRKVAVGKGPTTLSLDGGAVLVADSSGSAVSVVATASGAASTFSVAGTPVSVCGNAADVWVAAKTGRLLEYALGTHKLVRTTVLTATPGLIALSGTSVIVPLPTSGTARAVSTSTGAMRTFAHAGFGAYQALALGSFIFISDPTGYAITEINTLSGAVVRTIYGAIAPERMVRDGGFIFATARSLHQISRVAAVAP